jgi:Ser/Thr protein kinase RdoA (MazF antagonist)
VLWSRERGPTFVDLDDCRYGPAVQDLWMLVSGEADEIAVQLADLLEGYRTFFDFDVRELRLVEALRSLRIIHYAAWLAERWDDPAFPRSFPWFGSRGYWADHVASLRQQLVALAAPEPVSWA